MRDPHDFCNRTAELMIEILMEIGELARISDVIDADGVYPLSLTLAL